jgi:hypothetical protein
LSNSYECDPDIELRKLDSSLRMQYSYTFRYMDAVFEKLGRLNVLSNGKYKQLKELYVGAIVAQAFTEMTVNGWYYYVSLPESDPPDFILRRLVKEADHPGRTLVGTENFELVDYTDYSESIEEVLGAKLAKPYPADYSIAVLYRSKRDPQFNPAPLVAKHKNGKRIIVIVMRVEQTPQGSKYPEERYLVTMFDNPNYYMNWTQGGRGRDNKVHPKRFNLEMPD